MAKFVYRMQGILNVKEKMETQAKNEFAIASAKLREEEETLNRFYARLDGYEAELKELYSRVLDIPKITETQNAVEMMKYQIRMQMLRVKTAERELEAKRVALQEAMLDRKTHDKLKEREFEQFLVEVAAAESKEIDELVSYRFGQDKED